MAFEAVNEAILRGDAHYDLKLLIEDDNAEFVDFTDRTNADGTNRLISTGKIAVDGEPSFGTFSTSPVTIVVRNDDSFFNRKWSLNDDDLVTVKGNAALFATGLRRHKAKIQKLYYLKGGGTQTVDLNTYLIDRVQLGSTDSGQATIKLIGLSKPLRRCISIA